MILADIILNPNEVSAINIQGKQVNKQAYYRMRQVKRFYKRIGLNDEQFLQLMNKFIGGCDTKFVRELTLVQFISLFDEKLIVN